MKFDANGIFNLDTNTSDLNKIALPALSGAANIPLWHGSFRKQAISWIIEKRDV